MSTLPPQLLPWAEDLAQLTPELVLAIGPMIRRISSALGAMGQRRRLGQGEPDGYEGIARRGPYERLLISEWALAQELPDEFLRRASAGEHLFLAQRRLEPAATRCCVVLVDAGPDTMGNPRLAQVAALAVLRRRARMAGARFEWGLIQGTDLQEDLEPGALSRLRRQRTSNPPSYRHLERWLERLGAPSEPDDLWLLGSSALRHLEPPGHWLAIDDPLEHGDRQLALALHTRAGPRRLRVDLPTEPEAVQLLRALGQQQPRPTSPALALSPHSGMFFSWDDNRLLTLADNGDLVALHIPNSVNMARKVPPGKTRRLLCPRGWRVVAGGAAGRRVFALLLSEDGELRLERGPFALPTLDEPWVPSATLAPILRWSSTELVTIDGQGQAWRFRPGDASLLHEPGCRALMMMRNEAWVVDATRELRKEPGLAGPNRPGRPVRGAVLVNASTMAHEQTPGLWQIDDNPPFLAPDQQVLGLLRRGPAAQLLCLSEDGRVLSTQNHHGGVVLATIPEGIASACAGSHAPVVALRHRSGRLDVLDIDAMETRLTLSAGVDL